MCLTEIYPSGVRDIHRYSLYTVYVAESWAAVTKAPFLDSAVAENFNLAEVFVRFLIS